ncbi:MAG: signal peptidase I [Defluviitaleaceae bacterium]|nr:signal peptidase I [Defluviitaleaceae bacterium]
MNPEIRSEVIRNTVAWLKIIFIVFIAALFIDNVVIVNANVPTASMMDTVQPDDRLIASRLAYLITQPKRYDIVVLRYPDDRSKLFVKRIIGLPGETVNIRGGEVYITGPDGVEDPTPLDDSFLPEPADDQDFGPYEVPDGCYFMLGDNRNYSLDSRDWTNTYVPRNDIVGKVLFRYYPHFKWLLGK